MPPRDRSEENVVWDEARQQVLMQDVELLTEELYEDRDRLLAVLHDHAQKQRESKRRHCRAKMDLDQKFHRITRINLQRFVENGLRVLKQHLQLEGRHPDPLVEQLRSQLMQHRQGRRQHFGQSPQHSALRLRGDKHTHVEFLRHVLEEHRGLRENLILGLNVVLLQYQQRQLREWREKHEAVEMKWLHMKEENHLRWQVKEKREGVLLLRQREENTVFEPLLRNEDKRIRREIQHEVFTNWQRSHEQLESLFKRLLQMQEHLLATIERLHMEFWRTVSLEVDFLELNMENNLRANFEKEIVVLWKSFRQENKQEVHLIQREGDKHLKYLRHEISLVLHRLDRELLMAFGV